MTDASQEGTLAATLTAQCEAKLFQSLDTMLAAKVWSEHTDIDTVFMAKQAREAVFDLLRNRGVPIDALQHSHMETVQELGRNYVSDEPLQTFYVIVPDEPMGEASA